jgi:hypothetical protein
VRRAHPGRAPGDPPGRRPLHDLPTPHP